MPTLQRCCRRSTDVVTASNPGILRHREFNVWINKARTDHWNVQVKHKKWDLAIKANASIEKRASVAVCCHCQAQQRCPRNYDARVLCMCTLLSVPQRYLRDPPPHTNSQRRTATQRKMQKQPRTHRVRVCPPRTRPLPTPPATPSPTRTRPEPVAAPPLPDRPKREVSEDRPPSPPPQKPGVLRHGEFPASIKKTRTGHRNVHTKERQFDPGNKGEFLGVQLRDTALETVVFFYWR